MISIGKIFSFSAAHQLPHHEGQCRDLHGHNWKLDVEVTGPIQISGSSKEMIMDFQDLDYTINEAIIKIHDHKYLNVIYTNPVAENMIEDMVNIIQANLNPDITLVSLTLWETEKCYAKWTAD